MHQIMKAPIAPTVAPRRRRVAWFPLALAALAGLGIVPQAAVGQSSYPTCQPPGRSEYLLLVVSQTEASQTLVRKTLPANTNPTVCSYLDSVVMRVGGFNDLQIANSWAEYMSEVTGLATFVARPNQASVPPATTSATNPTASLPVAATPSPFPSPAVPSPMPQSVTSTKPQAVATATPATSYNPRPLGTGYAVLVDYTRRPEIATQVQKVVAKDIGLVAYEQRPYLLALYTSNQGTANSALKALSDRGFSAVLVDSRKVVLLRSIVSY